MDIVIKVQNLHIHNHGATAAELRAINLKLENIMLSQAELAAELTALTAQNEKATAEILAKIADLEAALAAAGGTTPEVDAALAALKASVQHDDDIVPDAPPL